MPPVAESWRAAVDKDKARIEVAIELLARVHGNLCNDRKLEQAEELSEILRRLLLLFQKT